MLKIWHLIVYSTYNGDDVDYNSDYKDIQDLEKTLIKFINRGIIEDVEDLSDVD